MIRFGASVSAVLLTCAACTPKDAEREAPKSVSQASVKSSTRTGPPGMLLAKWVCVGDNGSGMNGSTFEFRKDGSVKLHTSNGETITTKFKTETGRDWISRRLSDPKQSEDPAYSMWTKDGIWALYFSDPKSGEFSDGMPPRLFLDTSSRTIFAPLTETWCLVGEEAAYRKMSGADERESQAEERASRLERYKPQKDVTGRWKQVWHRPLTSPDRAICSMAVGDMNGDGSPEIIAPDQEGFVILDRLGKVVRKVPTPAHDGRYLIAGRRAGQGIVCQFRTWDDALTAYDSKGVKLWDGAPGSGKAIDWATPIAVDRENTGYVIGCNGGGLTFLGPDGKKRWTTAVETNVWNVAAGRLRGGQTNAVCVGVSGAWAYDTSGALIQKYDDPTCDCVGTADLNGDGIDEVLTLGTTGSSGGNLTAFNADGKKLWSHKASDVDVAVLHGVPFVSGRFGGKRLVGVGNGMTVRFFLPDGKQFGDYVRHDGIYAIATLGDKGSDRFLVLTESGLGCFELLP